MGKPVRGSDWLGATDSLANRQRRFGRAAGDALLARQRARHLAAVSRSPQRTLGQPVRPGCSAGGVYAERQRGCLGESREDSIRSRVRAQPAYRFGRARSCHRGVGSGGRRIRRGCWPITTALAWVGDRLATAALAMRRHCSGRRRLTQGMAQKPLALKKRMGAIDYMVREVHRYRAEDLFASHIQ